MQINSEVKKTFFNQVGSQLFLIKTFEINQKNYQVIEVFFKCFNTKLKSFICSIHLKEKLSLVTCRVEPVIIFFY